MKSKKILKVLWPNMKKKIKNRIQPVVSQQMRNQENYQPYFKQKNVKVASYISKLMKVIKHFVIIVKQMLSKNRTKDKIEFLD